MHFFCETGQPPKAIQQGSPLGSLRKPGLQGKHPCWLLLVHVSRRGCEPHDPSSSVFVVVSSLMAFGPLLCLKRP